MAFLSNLYVYIVVQPSWGVKELKIRGVLLISLLLFVSIFMAGCLQGEQTFEEIDVPEESIIYEEDDSDEDENGESDDEISNEAIETAETVLRELYLFDADGFVVPKKLEIPKTESVALTTLQYMVKNGPVTELLPNGFQAVLPADTEILGVNIKDDGTLIIDFSEEFLDYEAKDEVKILEALAHTMAQFDNVERIKLWINGHELNEMPVNGTPISSGYSPDKGINVYVESKPNIHTSQAVTVYYPKQYHEQYYHVPVTQYFDTKEQNIYESVVASLLTGPTFGIATMQVFNDGTELIEEPILHEGVLQLVFNDAVLKDEEKAMIADDVMETLVKSLTSFQEVEAVDVKVADRQVIVSENGTTYDRPVQLSDIDTLEKM